MMHIIEAEERISEFFSNIANVWPVDEDDDNQLPWPLSFITENDVEGSATLYERFNGTVVLRIDADVITVPDSPTLREWVTTRTGWMPFVQARVEKVDGQNVKIVATHSFLADQVTEAELAQVIGSFDYVVERWSDAIVKLQIDAEMKARRDAARNCADSPSTVDATLVVSVPETPEPATKSVLQELDDMVGLDPVKALVRQITNMQKVARVRRRNGLNAVAPSPHLVFTGNPGTGKTTVARHIGRIYKKLGLLTNGHVVEVDRGQLVGGYIGQTAIKTREALESAKGGVLFIDEAYSLARDHANDYGHEAIETIMAYMENNRGQIVVVVAGYPEEMKTFMAMNPGLASRFDYTLQFPDYSNSELVRIFERLANEYDYVLDEHARDAVALIASSWQRCHGFGNAREVRRLFHEVVATHGAWLMDEGISSGDQLRQLQSIHFPVGEALAEIGERERACETPNGDAGYI